MFTKEEVKICLNRYLKDNTDTLIFQINIFNRDRKIIHFSKEKGYINIILDSPGFMQFKLTPLGLNLLNS